jgi:hypothetical protein
MSKKMEKKIKIEGLDNRRYSINTIKSKNSYNIVISIQIRTDLIWKDIYTECFIITDESLYEKVVSQTHDDFRLITNNTHISEFYVKIFDDFEIADIFENIEENFQKKELLNNKIAPLINDIETQIKEIDEIAYSEED